MCVKRYFYYISKYQYLLLYILTLNRCCRFGTGFCFTVVYAALLTKTNRISRIFNASKHSAKRPILISPSSQLAVCAGLVSIQVMCNILKLNNLKDLRKLIYELSVNRRAGRGRIRFKDRPTSEQYEIG